MTFILHPWQLLLVILAGWVNQQQQQIIEFQRTEIDVLKEKLGKKRIILNDDQRRLLAVKGKVLGRKVLEEIGGLFTPDTILRWHRQPVAQKWDYSNRRKTSLDPRQMREWIPQITYGARAFFTGEQTGTRDKARQFEYFLARRREILPWIKEFSAYEWASADDPPMLHCYGGQRDVIPALDAGNATHHPKFGEHLHTRLKDLGVESYYWADNVRCEDRRYDGWAGVRRFVCDKMRVELPEEP